MLLKAILYLAENPVELFQAELLPSRVSPIEEFLCTFIIVNERAWLTKKIILRLITELGYLVHVLRAAVIALVLRVLDRLMQSLP